MPKDTINDTEMISLEIFSGNYSSIFVTKYNVRKKMKCIFACLNFCYLGGKYLQRVY